VGLLSDLGPGPVGLDSSIFIYFIEGKQHFLPILDPLFSAIEAGELAVVTSSLTLLEVLVRPLRLNLPTLADEYEQILRRSSGIMLVPMSPRLLRLAAHLRAATAMKTPDAIQLASALIAGCTSFLTNDQRIPPVPGIRIVLAGHYLGPE
jgi:predicted nucleic acid-binding protein